jgi:hypothetical protein
MSTPLYVGTTTFREVAANPVVNRNGLDTLTIVLRGKVADLAAQTLLWTRGISYTGYPNMFLDSKSTVDKGPVAEITLNFIGFIESGSLRNGLIDRKDGISRQSVTLNTDDDEDITFAYYSQTTTARWISRTAAIPQAPRFPATVPTTIPIAQLFAPYPPKYTGSISGRYKVEGRLSQFDRDELSPSVWSVVESWEILIEPDL